MKALFGIALSVILLTGMALAEDHSGALFQLSDDWKVAFVRKNNIWVAKGDATDQ